MRIAEIIFWISLVFIVYGYFGYPLILWFLSSLFPRPLSKRNRTVFVSIIVAVHNEEKFIRNKISNLLSLNYPKDKYEILIGSDGSIDSTVSIVEEYLSDSLKLFKWDERRGKVSVLNDLIKQARGEIIVFADTRQIIDKNAIKELGDNFSDESVGCVSGELVLQNPKKNSFSEGVGLYWQYEKFIRKSESILNSVVGGTGAVK